METTNSTRQADKNKKSNSPKKIDCNLKIQDYFSSCKGSKEYKWLNLAEQITNSDFNLIGKH